MKRLLIEISILLIAMLLISFLGLRVHRLSANLEREKSNVTSLVEGVEFYKVSDSLNAARVSALELSLSEYKRFRAEDAALIKQLRTRNRDLASVNKTQSQTIIELLAIPKDTVIIRDSIQVPAVSVHCGDAWFDFDGLLTPVEFTGTLRNRDSLVIAESVRYKRFLGFLWKTKQVKDRRVDVVNKNPHTSILNVDFVVIEKR